MATILQGDDDKTEAMAAYAGGVSERVRKKLKEALQADADRRRITGQNKNIDATNAANVRLSKADEARRQAYFDKWSYLSDVYQGGGLYHGDKTEYASEEGIKRLAAERDAARDSYLNFKPSAQSTPIAFPAADIDATAAAQKKQIKKTQSRAGGQSTILSGG